MPLLITVGAVTTVAVIYYKKKKAAEDDFESRIDLTNKTVVDLLPLEQSMTLFEAPIATVTFFEGNPDVASQYLRERVASIAQQNPWLGGWLRLENSKEGNGEVKLYYDAAGDELVPGLFASFDAGVINLSTETPYPVYEKLMRDDPVTVKSNSEIVGRDDEPLWRVSLIPDAVSPESRFAVVVSMSHVCGDNHTFYCIHRMLGMDNDIVKLNPHRSTEFTESVIDKMGKKEAEYMKNVSTPSKWEDWMEINAKERLFEKHMFVISKDWLDKEKEKNKNGGVEEQLSTNDLVTSWFWNTVRPAVGLMVYNFRNRLGPDMCTDKDAGNYHNPIPYCPADYATPQLIRQSLASAKRASSGEKNKPLPKFSWEDTSFSVSTNWSTFNKQQRQGGEDQQLLKFGKGCTSGLHVPLFYPSHLDCMPSKMSLLVLFNAGGGKLGAFIMVPKSVVPDIEASGIVEETITRFESEVIDRRFLQTCR